MNYLAYEGGVDTDLRREALQQLLEFSGTFATRIEPRQEVEIRVERFAFVLGGFLHNKKT